MAEQLPVLVLIAGVLVASRLRPLRELTPERRLGAVALLAGLALVALHALAARWEAALATGTLPSGLPAVVAGAGSLVGAAALALLWSAILDDTGRSIARVLLLVLILAFLLLSLAAVPVWPFLALIAALRSGWVRLSPERTPLATLAALLGLTLVLLWPAVPALPACWPPGCHGGLPLLRTARAFLALQLGLVSLRLIFRLIFGPRRIGRRLLVSHMMAGAVPVALISLFLILVALLAIAHFRATLSARLLREHHAVSQTMLTTRTAGSPLEGWRAGAEPESLAALAGELGRRWAHARGWTPATGETTPRGHGHGRFYVALGAEPGSSGSIVAEIAGDPPAPVAWVHQSGEDEESRGELTRLRQLPGPEAWRRRPQEGSELGLVKSCGCSFHVTEQVVPATTGGVRVQIIEALPYGRVGLLEELLGETVWLEERVRFTCRGPDESDSSQTAPAGAIHLLQTDTLAVQPRAARTSTSYRSSYVLLPAQEWFPPGARLRVASEERPLQQAPLTLATAHWAEIRVPLLGVSQLGDLMPPLPALRENPLSALPIIVLLATALLFVAVEATAFVSALRIGRAIAHSVGLLRAGTERLQTGDLGYRIRMTGQDELTALGTAFNEMAAGLERGQRVALEKERLEGELEVARRIQQRLLPARPPAIAGWEFAGRSVPARQVGGDYFDLLPLTDDRLLLVLADVSGKGVPAALLMSSVRASLHTMVTGREQLREIMARLNRFVHASTGETEFVTLCLGLLQTRSGRLRYTIAGHDPPYLLRRDSGIERLEEGGLLLGAFPHAEYREGRVVLQPGDLLFAFTDGLSEAMNPREEMFGNQRIAAVLRDACGTTSEAFVARMLERVGVFTGDAEPYDDITLLAIRRTLKER
ncbi:MAG: SpoIIE family protein phosphatase [Candidatus Eisenbacteria bacterium]|nr:SpoIIE family protein phosphatase [Candidatus Eisenbacteria bacterium]